MNFTKRTLIILLTAIILVSVFSIFAIGKEAESEEPTSEGSAEEPELSIASKNLKYSSYIHILVAIDADTVPSDAQISLRVSYSENSETEYVVNKHETTSITFEGKAKEYVVFSTNGIVARDIARTLYMTPVLTLSDGSVKVGKTTKYSVAEYCYERLCSDGFAAKVASDGADYHRKELYEALLGYGSAAHAHLGGSSPSPESVSYLSIQGTSSDFSGIKKVGETAVAVFDPTSLSEHYAFEGWDVYFTDTEGITTRKSYSEAKISFQLTGGGVLVLPNISKDAYAQRQEEIAAAEKQDAIDREDEWTALRGAFMTKLGYSEQNSDMLIYELKNLYTLYGREMVSWAANLYSKGYMYLEEGIWAGGFYASSAGKAIAGYGPDLQSTVQLLRFLQQAGVLNSISSDIPEWMQTELVYFAKSLQHENGFFYHPQWGKEYTDQRISRRGRDLGWGTSLLSFFGAAPQYDTPSGTKGDGIDADEYLELMGLQKPQLDGSSAFLTTSTAEDCSCCFGGISHVAESGVILTSNLAESPAYAVSKVILAASESSETEYMSSHTAFINYLLTTIEPGMKSSAYSTGNTLNATNGQIGNFSKLLGAYTYTAGDEINTSGATADDYKRFDGMTLNEMLLEVLDSTVNPLLGLYGSWTESGGWSTDLTFANSNGFFKVISIYNGRGRAYPAPAQAAISLIDNLTNPDLPSTGNACDVYNVWNAISSLKSNVSSSEEIYAVITNTSITPASEGDEGATLMTVKQFIDKALEIRGADAVRVTFDKIKGYKKVDGGFSHSYYRGATNHQGCPIAPSNNVSDVDGTCIASTGLVRSLFDAFGLGSYRPAFFGKADYMIFIDTIEEMRPVRKTDSKNLIEDFEDDDLKNAISGDFEIKEGKLSVNGNARIARSELSTVGNSLIVTTSISKIESATFELISNGDVIDKVILEALGDTVKVTRASTGSYALCDVKSGIASITLSYLFSENGFEADILSGGVSIMSEKLPSRITDPYDIKELSITSSGELILDDLTFGMIHPTFSLKNESGRLDFSSLVEGVLDEITVGEAIRFTNQTEPGANHSEALIISEGNNKYLRLDDKWSKGSASQNYFDFLTEIGVKETFVFETKMRVNRISGGVIPITISGNSAAYYCSLGVESGYISAGVCANKSGVTSNLIKTNVKMGEWFTVRVEYTADATYSEDTFSVSIYINNTLIKTENALSSTLDYCPASQIKSVRMACDTNWLGTLDYDDIYLGSKADYKPIVPSEAHTHSVQVRIEDEIAPSCTVGGSYTAITYCSDDSCGKLLSVAYIKTAPACKSSEEVIENLDPGDCYNNGSYDSVYYCVECKKELSRVTVVTTTSHQPATREENTVKSTCDLRGSCELVTYCSICSGELKREVVSLPLDFHTVKDGKCTVCQSTDFEVFGIETFEDMDAKAYLVDKSRHNFDKTENGSFASLSGAPDHVNAQIITEGDNKYLSLQRIRNDTSASTWVDFIRSGDEVIDKVVFESRVRYDVTTLGGGIYIRFYTGRTTGGSGTRVTNHTMSRNGNYITYAGTKTHARLGEWFTMRATLEATDSGNKYTFLIKNETASAITFGGVTYKVGEYIPYYTTTSLLVTPESVNDINGFTFMQSTGSLCTVSLDNSYLGGSERYISR